VLFVYAALHCWTTGLWAFEATPATTSWQVYFSPEGGCTQAIVNAIGAAHQQVMVQAYEMTSPQIKKALVAAQRRGVKMQTIFDPSALKEYDTMVGELSAGGIPVFIDSAHSPGLAHNKVMIIDRAVVITGSFNFTRAAESRNAENLLIIRAGTPASQQRTQKISPITWRIRRHWAQPTSPQGNPRTTTVTTIGIITDAVTGEIEYSRPSCMCA
jgi:phosphatidylserine/phosphatidylglycerophosphate/cardiolipin synthase-like enzyme